MQQGHAANSWSSWFNSMLTRLFPAIAAVGRESTGLLSRLELRSFFLGFLDLTKKFKKNSNAQMNQFVRDRNALSAGHAHAFNTTK